MLFFDLGLSISINIKDSSWCFDINQILQEPILLRTFSCVLWPFVMCSSPIPVNVVCPALISLIVPCYFVFSTLGMIVVPRHIHSLQLHCSTVFLMLEPFPCACFEILLMNINIAIWPVCLFAL